MDEIIAECGSKILDLNQQFYLNSLSFNLWATGRSIGPKEYSDGLLAALTELAEKSNAHGEAAHIARSRITK